MGREIDGVLFDVDGTLVDSGYHHALAWWQALRRHDVDVPMSTIHRAIGMGGDNLVPHVLKESGLPSDAVDPDAADSAHGAIFSTYWPALRAFAGARDLVMRAHRSGLRTVLASSAGADELAVLRKLLDVDDHLDAATGSADAQQSKPAPELVRIGLQKVGLAPERAVFIGDAVWDVRAASDAGVRCVALECGGTSAAELREAGAVEVYRDPAALVESWNASLLSR